MAGKWRMCLPQAHLFLRQHVKVLRPQRGNAALKEVKLQEKLADLAHVALPPEFDCYSLCASPVEMPKMRLFHFLIH